MELTTEAKQRIEEEERRRISEERYRAEVRAKLQGESGAAKKKLDLPRVIGIGGIGIALFIGAIIWANNSGGNRKHKSDSPSAAPAEAPAPVAAPILRTRYIPVDQKIASGQIEVKAQSYVQYRVTIMPEMVRPVLTGSFNTSGGSGNDIMAVIADEANFINWINGHQAQVYWTTQGRATTGNFAVRLQPGTYYLAFNNRFSLFTGKQVFLEADLNYERVERYYDQGGPPPVCPLPPCTGTIDRTDIPRVGWTPAPAPN